MTLEEIFRASSKGYHAMSSHLRSIEGKLLHLGYDVPGGAPLPGTDMTLQMHALLDEARGLRVIIDTYARSMELLEKARHDVLLSEKEEVQGKDAEEREA
ncbi:uncharacterized protein H6S33_007942 [Morchella sextelata]|uniref:uncharacterized protein n=1 Tax=Morchella sextelata TaxID=1174677 RepID=UPI001D0494C8|nr:uncharacterized protein H6S33_007942 [Morchella sextelata]KAH0602938.1 hypothetical protein H6S33_007942 [Morchella sextelata]